MEHRKLGTSNLELPVVTFGAWAIGGLFWGGADDDEAVRAIQAAIDAGIDAIDTAPVYGCGHSEELVGRAIRGQRDRVKVLTKCSLRWDSTEGEYYFTIDAPAGGKVTVYKDVTAASIQYECEQSLRRLGIETIDLYQVHWPSESASAEETMSILNRLREQGKIREIGVSNYGVPELTEAAALAPVVSDQVKYNLLDRSIESTALPYCRDHNVGVICYSPMAMGLLTGKVTMTREFPATDVRSSNKWYRPEVRRSVLAALERVRPIAERHTASLAQLSVAWVLAQPGVTTALVGARTARQVSENAAAAVVKLTSEEVLKIRDVFSGIASPV
jgi:aryl-alcohol dehydrogenase-like predicted oxidoreductase